MDPHSQWLDTNTAYYNHIYSALTKIDEKSQIGPDLALSWQTVSPTEWHFKLRPGIKFHNGEPLMAKDVVASIQRARTLPNATSPYTGAISSVQDVSAIDDLTVSVKTTRADPALLLVLATSRSFRNRSPSAPRTASTPAQAWWAPDLTSS